MPASNLFHNESCTLNLITTYKEAWNFLDNLQFFKIKLGLDSMTSFLDSLGNPQAGLKFIHVAGTNGKGSTTATLLALLSEAGYKTGIYTSPHLSSVRERFRINDSYIPQGHKFRMSRQAAQLSYISEAEFTRHAGRIHAILNGRQITYFEFTTALALLWFAEQQVDIVILEVGMGGRLDATNVITPLVGIITNVAMDHEAYLGHTLKEIAAEKAGIIKSGVPLVSAVAADDSREVVEAACNLRQAPLFLLDREFSMSLEKDNSWTYNGLAPQLCHLTELTLALAGHHQGANTAVALAALELLHDHGFTVSPTQIRTGLAKVRWPGRLEYFELPRPDTTGAPLRVLLDGAHNPAGVLTLKEALLSGFPRHRLIMVWASMADKDMAGTLGTIAPLCDQLIFTMPESERSATPEALAGLLPIDQKIGIHLTRTVSEALARAQQLANNQDDLLCIAGSLYLVGAARRILLGELAP